VNPFKKLFVNPKPPVPTEKCKQELQLYARQQMFNDRAPLVLADYEAGLEREAAK
jgi:hypothetical protein